MLNLMYITNNPNVAKIAQKNGVDRIFLDLEINGKEARQGHLNTVISRHSINDVAKLRAVLTTTQLLVRVNPIYSGSKAEIDKVIDDGADIVLLPFFKTRKEVEQFLHIVNGRAKTCLLCETPQAVEYMDEILELKGIDEIHIGMNDLHLGYKMKFMFELLCNGTVDSLCAKFKANKITYGFGGIAGLEGGLLPAKYIIGEHYRLGSQMAILSRSFYNTDNIDSLDEVDKIFQNGVSQIHEYEKFLQKQNQEFFTENHKVVERKVDAIKQIITAKQQEKVKT